MRIGMLLSSGYIQYSFIYHHTTHYTVSHIHTHTPTHTPLPPQPHAGFDCSALWVRDRDALLTTFETNPEYLRTIVGSDIIDYRNWQIPLGRRFRSLKVWFVLRSYGLERLRSELRDQVAYAKALEALVRADSRLAMMYEVHLGLLSFRVEAGPDATRALLVGLNNAGYFVTHSVFAGKYFVRISITFFNCDSDVQDLWSVIQHLLDNPTPPPPLTGDAH